MITVRVQGVSKRYRIVKGSGAAPSFVPARLSRRARPRHRKDIWALRDVTFKVASGTVLGIVGANGAGKSTLLKVLARITPPTSGRARVRGRVVPLLEVGGAFQPEATGRENVFLNAALFGIPREDAQRRLDDIVDFAGVQDFVDTPVKRYSSGMYLRLAFSVAVNMDPDILLADEVLAVGDLAFQERCLRKVEQASAEGLTVLFVSHDMAAVRRLCGRVIWLNAGRIVDDGDPESVVGAYEESAWQLLAGNEKGGSHVNKYGEILHTRLLSADRVEKGAGRVSEELVVRVTLRMDWAGIGFRCVLVFSADGVDAFRTVQPEVAPVPEPGIYTADVRIPAHLLADTVYNVKTGVWIQRDGREPREYALVRPHALNFRVYDSEESASARGTYIGPLHGVVRPRLDWRVARHAEADQDAVSVRS